MKAMVLAAGLGLRMRPLTLLRAKPALPVLNRPLIHWTLRRLARAGVRDVVVNLHHLPESVVAALGDGRGLGVRVRYSLEPQLLGTGGGPKAARSFFGAEPFLIVNGDTLFDLDLRRLMARHRACGARATLALRENPDPKAYATVVTDRRGRILAIGGHPKRSQGTVSMFAGVHVMEPDLLDRLPEGASDSVRDLYLPLLASGEPVQGVRCAGAWHDLGRPSLYRDAQLRLLPGGRCLVGRGVRISSGARLRRSVVGAGARIEAGARVERSVLWDGAVIRRGARVSRAIVTTGASVEAGERAEQVVVLPGAAVASAAEAGGRLERRGEMAWVSLR